MISRPIVFVFLPDEKMHKEGHTQEEHGHATASFGDLGQGFEIRGTDLFST